MNSNHRLKSPTKFHCKNRFRSATQYQDAFDISMAVFLHIHLLDFEISTLSTEIWDSPSPCTRSYPCITLSGSDFSTSPLCNLRLHVSMSHSYYLSFKLKKWHAFIGPSGKEERTSNFKAFRRKKNHEHKKFNELQEIETNDMIIHRKQENNYAPGKLQVARLLNKTHPFHINSTTN